MCLSQQHIVISQLRCSVASMFCRMVISLLDCFDALLLFCFFASPQPPVVVSLFSLALASYYRCFVVPCFVFVVSLLRRFVASLLVYQLPTSHIILQNEDNTGIEIDDTMAAKNHNQKLLLTRTNT